MINTAKVLAPGIYRVAMIFSQLSGCRSLRDLEIRFNAKSQNHYHLRATNLKRSTLSDANKNRDQAVFRDIASQLINNQGTEIKDVVSLIDSSIIRIDGRGSKWTESTETSREKGLKLHIQYASNNHLIEHASITSTNINDITQAKEFDIESGRIYVFDKGYADYNWWYKISMNNAYFVTRLKKNSAYKVIKDYDITGCSENIKSDRVIEFTNKYPGGSRRNLLAGRSAKISGLL